MTISHVLQQSKEINNYIKKLVDIGYTRFDKTMEIQKDKIVSLIINELGNDTYDIFIDCDLLSKFNEYLISASSNDAVDLAGFMRQQVLNKYQDDLYEMFAIKNNSMRIAS